MLTNEQWLLHGIDWERKSHLGELGTLSIIPGLVHFSAIKHPSNTFSVYHYVFGSSGQQQFELEVNIKAYLESQLDNKEEYVRLINKHIALNRRVEPLLAKLNIVRKQMDTLY